MTTSDIELNDADFKKVKKAIDNPPKPTPELVALLTPATDVELQEAWDKLDFFWRWIERAYFDKNLSIMECVGCLAHSPYAPWNFDRESWNTKHKEYDADIEAVIEQSRRYSTLAAQVEGLRSPPCESSSWDDISATFGYKRALDDVLKLIGGK